MHSPSCIQAFPDSEALFRFARGLFKHTKHGYLSVLSDGEKDHQAFLVRNGNRGLRPVLWLVPAFRCLLYELPPFHSNVSTYPSGQVTRHQRNISVRFYPEEVALHSENDSPVNSFSASNILTPSYQALGPQPGQEQDSEFLIFADEESQENDVTHMTAVLTPQIDTARPSIHQTIPQIAERVHRPANGVTEQAESALLAGIEDYGARHATIWTDIANGDVTNVRQPPNIHLDLEKRHGNITAITRHNVRQLFPSLSGRRPLPSVPIQGGLLSPFPQTPKRSSSSYLQDAFWAKSYTPRHIYSSHSEQRSITEPTVTPSVGPRPRSQSDPASEVLPHLDVLLDERSAATSAQYNEDLTQETTIDRVELLTSALLQGQRLRRSSDPELYCLTEAEAKDEDEFPTISGPRYERPANPEPPSPLSANAQRIVHNRSLRLERDIPSHTNAWTSTPATDPHARPIYIIAAHEPGCASRRPFTSYYTFSAVSFNPEGRSALTTPVIDEFWADEDFHHAETIVGSPLFRGREDVERLDEALERIEMSLYGADFDLIDDDADKENEYPDRKKATSDTNRNRSPSDQYDGANKPKSGYELWKELQDRLKDERDPEIRRNVLGEVAQILQERTKVRTRGLRDPFVRSHQEEVDAEQERRYRQGNRALALRVLTGTANSPETGPSPHRINSTYAATSRMADLAAQRSLASQPGSTVVHRRVPPSPTAHRLTRTDPPREARRMAYSTLMHPTPFYPPGFFQIAFLNREWELRARTEPPRRSEPAQLLPSEIFHVMNAPVQFRGDRWPAHLPHTPEQQRMSTSMAMRLVELGPGSSGRGDNEFDAFIAGVTTEDSS